MSELDKKLKQILANLYVDGLEAADPPSRRRHLGTITDPISHAEDEIKQAFTEAGYKECTEITGLDGVAPIHAHWLETDEASSNIRPDVTLRLTGREWYRRFVNELGKPEYFHDVDTGNVTGYKLEDVGLAAKKASGIE